MSEEAIIRDDSGVDITEFNIDIEKVIDALHNFMPGCTHPGVAQGTTCPLCGRVV